MTEKERLNLWSSTLYPKAERGNSQIGLSQQFTSESEMCFVYYFCWYTIKFVRTAQIAVLNPDTQYC